MALFLVSRSTDNDNHKLPNDINGILINGTDVDNAVALAEVKLAALVGPNHAKSVASWTALQVDATDGGADVQYTLFQGAVVLPGKFLLGGGLRF